MACVHDIYGRLLDSRVARKSIKPASSLPRPFPTTTTFPIVRKMAGLKMAAKAKGQTDLTSFFKSPSESAPRRVEKMAKKPSTKKAPKKTVKPAKEVIDVDDDSEESEDGGDENDDGDLEYQADSADEALEEDASDEGEGEGDNRPRVRAVVWLGTDVDGERGRSGVRRQRDGGVGVVDVVLTSVP